MNSVSCFIYYFC